MAVAPNWKLLFDAVERNDKATVKRCIKEGLPAATVDPKGETAAHLATRKGNLAILEYLLAEDKSLLSAKNNAGQNVLFIAVTKGAMNIVKYLIENCHVDILHEENVRVGDTVLHIAAREGHLEMLKYFIEVKNVDVNILNEKGEPPAFSAAGNKKLPIVKYLHEQCNANIMMMDYENRNILFPAAMKGDVTVPTYILDEKKIDLEIDWRDKGGRTVLHWSALSNYLKVSQYFVEVKKADVNMPDLMKQTPLHLAAQAGHLRLVEFLYETGADPELPDISGLTPVQLSTDRKVIKFFTDFPKKRQRRSLSPLSSLRHSPQPVPYQWEERLVADRSRRCISDGHTCLRQAGEMSSGLDGFLVLANAYIGHSERRYRRPSSPMKSARSRIDPIAVDVLRRLL